MKALRKELGWIVRRTNDQIMSRDDREVIPYDVVPRVVADQTQNFTIAHKLRTVERARTVGSPEAEDFVRTRLRPGDLGALGAPRKEQTPKSLPIVGQAIFGVVANGSRLSARTRLKTELPLPVQKLRKTACRCAIGGNTAAFIGLRAR